MTLLAVAVGGALGATLRVLAALGMSTRGAPAWSATMVVNGLGCLVIGWLFVVIERRLADRVAALHLLSSLLLTGVLGGCTTLSTFSFEVVELAQAGDAGVAAAVGISSIVLCVGGAALGSRIGGRADLPISRDG